MAGASYAVRWLHPSGALLAGKLELRARAVVLEGSNGHAGECRELPYDDLAGVRVDRGARDCIGGRPTLVLAQRSGEEVRVAGISPAGIVSEVAQRIAELQARNVSVLGIVVPLKPGTRAQVEELLAHGPPFDPEEAGLEEHRVLVTDEEAIFVFASVEHDALEGLAAQAHVWTAAAEWGELVAGPPRIAEAAYLWRRHEPVDNLTTASTPGPGDSEGGDIYPPS